MVQHGRSDLFRKSKVFEVKHVVGGKIELGLRIPDVSQNHFIPNPRGSQPDDFGGAGREIGRDRNFSRARRGRLSGCGSLRETSEYRN